MRGITPVAGNETDWKANDIEQYFREAEKAAAKAAELLGQADGQASAAGWAAVAQVYATLALAAAERER